MHMPAGPDISLPRLLNQQILTPPLRKPADVVSRLCAMQAQDFAGVLWSVGLRMHGATETGIKKALADRQVIRTWLLRGTLHLTSPGDVRWILGLTATRTMAKYAGRHRQLGLSADDLVQSRAVLKKELEGGRALTREEVFHALERAGISPEGQRGYHLLATAGLSGLICFGSVRGKQQTFVLLDEWAPAGDFTGRGDPAAELAARYIAGHGPATPEDFAWWSGLPLSAARAGIREAGHSLKSFIAGGKEYFHGAGVTAAHTASGTPAFLLPGFDEYIVGYRDRSPLLDPRTAEKTVIGSNGMMLPVIVIDGKVAGTWKRMTLKKGITIHMKPFQEADRAQKRLVQEAAERYGRFVGLPVIVGW